MVKEYLVKIWSAFFYNVLIRLVTLIAYVPVRAYYSLEWSQIKTIQSSKLVKGMSIWLVVVPVASKVFQHIGKNPDITLFDHKFPVDLVLPFSWQAFFAAALLCVLANIIYILSCPRLVKENDHFGTFESNGMGMCNLRQYNFNLNRLSDEAVERLIRLAGIEKEDLEGDDLQSHFWRSYISLNHSLILVRFLCCFAYAFALLLLSSVLWESIQWVYSQTDLVEFTDRLYFWPIFEWLYEHGY